MRPITDIKLTNKLNRHTTAKKMASSNALIVHSYDELVREISELAYLNREHLLFYRGQGIDYRNKAKNSTFYPTIYRDRRITKQVLKTKFRKLDIASQLLIDAFVKNKIIGRYEVCRRKYIQWSILQHYEVTETPLIDVTQSLKVACSFALRNTNQKDDEYAYVYVFGLPYLTNRISINSEQELINIRLLSIAPPPALRPHFQEGYLVGTDEITDNYSNKTELDLNKRLVAKFKFLRQNAEKNNFTTIPNSLLFPPNDSIRNICDEIKKEINSMDI